MESASTSSFGAAVVGTALVLRRWLCKPTYNSIILTGTDGSTTHMPPFETQEQLDRVTSYLTSDAEGALDPMVDVWIATYPKCGTTWLQQICVELLRTDVADDAVAPTKKSFMLSPWPEHTFGNDPPRSKVDENGLARDPTFFRGHSAADMADCVMGPPEARCRPMKTHAPVTLLPGAAATKEDRVRAIVITRNAKDACVSMYHHASRIPVFGYDGGFLADWTHRWSEGSVESGCYFEWHRQWYVRYLEGEAEENILWLTFEAVKGNPLCEIAKIARFLHLDTVPGRSASDFEALVKRAHESSSFKKMKAQYSNTRFGAKKGGMPNSGHFRKGGVGDWRNHFNRGESDRFDALQQEKLGRKHPDLVAMYDFGVDGQAW